MAIHPIYSIYAELEDFTPTIWRRFEVIGNKSIAELGYILMTLFEMKASHLFCFIYDNNEEIIRELRDHVSSETLDRIQEKKLFPDLVKPWLFELPLEDRNVDDQVLWHDASQYRIKDIINEIPTTLSFEYDYGDGWQVNLKFEKLEKVRINAKELPRVLAGEGFGIIEDCGGPGGMMDMAKAFKKKTGRQYHAYREWLGVDDLDLTTIDLDDLNFRLKKLPRIFKECYEYQYEPTQRSLDLLERKYKLDNQ